MQNYWSILVNGTPGKRAQIDVEPAPAECRRLYEAHRAAFDQAAGVRVGEVRRVPRDLPRGGRRQLRGGGRGGAHAVTSLAAEVAAGRAPADVAKARGLEAGSWSASPAETWVEKGRGGTSMEEVDAWAFDAARRVGDTKVLDGPRGMLVAYVILAVRPSQTKTYEQALPGGHGPDPVDAPCVGSACSTCWR